MPGHQIILTLISGAIVGFSLGLLGGGGSILAVPLLMYFVGVKDAHEVIGTSALAVSLNAYFNLIPHWRQGHVRWGPAILFAIPGVLGAIIGSDLGKLVNGKDLLFLFAILMFVVAGLMIRRERANQTRQMVLETVEATSAAHVAEVPLKKRVLPVAVTGFAVGALSGFFGIGGGFLIVPGLIFSTGMSIIQAIGSSLFAVGTFGLTTAVNYALSGWVSAALAGEFILGGILGGLGGALLATRLSRQKSLLNYLFAGVIFLMALYMIDKNLSVLHLHP
ncbi:protein of unknown function DUF81 [Sulfobacillus acidophilus TPY]|uniref:Probable membrane transporter protein n=1 Tax=Sulfobacillus acidophilus (strain ATCC 700253 / DSM 10332 / NAL) TaxID=679936 RepID=G8TT96_SULAD|nr:protein of unknown function DUF81 [Sulfobacillus acidophilus TPY]AEW04476.1 protein of unknown function DUF81 [Sulfobacillus acidophilus DSM 10332]